eukprot:609282-Prymnesium_polylepis.1
MSDLNTKTARNKHYQNPDKRTGGRRGRRQTQGTATARTRAARARARAATATKKREHTRESTDVTPQQT